MGNDLPDYTTEVKPAVTTADKLKGGADAAKSASPTAYDVYLATDTKKLYICIVDGSWTGFDASIFVQGILTLYADMAGGGYEIKSIKDPTAAQSAATKKYIDDLVALYLLLTGGTMSGAIAMGTNKITGMGDPTLAQDAATRAYVLAQIKDWLLKTGGTMSGAIAMGTNKITGMGDPTDAQDAATKTYADTKSGSKLITASRAAAAASGDVSYTGVGFTPTAIICLAVGAGTTTPQYSIGFADAALASMCIYRTYEGTVVVSSTTYCIYSARAVGVDVQEALLKSMDANGFTLTWTAVTTPDYATTLIFLCLR